MQSCEFKVPGFTELMQEVEFWVITHSHQLASTGVATDQIRPIEVTYIFFQMMTKKCK